MNIIQPYFLWLHARHGRTTDNENEIFTGTLGGELAPAGIEQARQMGREVIATVKPNIVKFSPLHRASQTAEEALKASKDLGYKPQSRIDWRIRERSFGELDGADLTEVRRLISEKGLVGLDDMQYFDERYQLGPGLKQLVTAFGVESPESIAARMTPFESDIRLAAKMGVTNIYQTIAHGAINGYMFEYAVHRTVGENVRMRPEDGPSTIDQFLGQHNNEISILVYDRAGDVVKELTQPNVPLEAVHDYVKSLEGRAGPALKRNKDARLERLNGTTEEAAKRS